MTVAAAAAVAAGLRYHRAMSATDPPLPPGNPQDGLRGQVPVSPISGAQHTMTSLLWALLRKPPVACAPSVPVREVLAHMRAQRVGAMVAVHADFTPAGILTERDVIERVVLDATALDAPLSRLMTPNPVSLDENASAFDAALLMARHGVRHVPVTRGGRLIGMVSERDLFALQRTGMREVSRTINQAGTDAELAAAAADVRLLARQLLAQGMAIEQLTQLIVALNDRVMARAIELTAELTADPAGVSTANPVAPPIANPAANAAETPAAKPAARTLATGQIDFCWIVLGSEGRMEQTISTDQDNGLIFLPVDTAATGPVRAQLLAAAARINQSLAQAGFPLCKGGIMASNPAWCLSLSEWQARFDDWLHNPAPAALLNAAIFFDLRPMHGNAALASRLHHWLLDQAQQRPAFLRMLAQNALQTAPPLTVFGTLAASGKVDLKGAGARLFIDAARVLALAQGITATHTAQRLRLAAAGAPGTASAQETEAMVDAFHFIQSLRLKRQFKAMEDGGLPNEIELASLNQLDHRILQEAFHQARKLQSRLRLDYAL